MGNDAKGEFVDYRTIGFLLLSLTPQFPMSLHSFDGNTYIYNSDCCQPDDHVGLIYSDVEITDLGCGKTPTIGFPEPIPAATIGGPPTGNVLMSCPLNISNTVTGNFDVGATSYPSFYDGNLTAFGIKDKNSVVRWFTVVKFKYNYTSTAGTVNDHVFPMLMQSRPTQKIELSDGSDLHPVNSWMLPNAVNKDWTKDFIGSLTLYVPDPAFASFKFMSCFILNRPY